MPESLTGADALLALEEIKRVKARYFRHLDYKDWDSWRDVFTEDAVMVMPEASLDLHGSDAIVDTVRGLLDPVLTIHHGHNPEIDLIDADNARGIWAMEDYLIYPNGTPAEDGSTLISLRGYGHYHEQYRRTSTGWRICRTQLNRLHIDTTQHRRFTAARG